MPWITLKTQCCCTFSRLFINLFKLFVCLKLPVLFCLYQSKLCVKRLTSPPTIFSSAEIVAFENYLRTCQLAYWKLLTTLSLTDSQMLHHTVTIATVYKRWLQMGIHQKSPIMKPQAVHLHGPCLVLKSDVVGILGFILLSSITIMLTLIYK